MEFQCVGNSCSKKVYKVSDIPYVCSCGLLGKFSYYSTTRIKNFIKKLLDKRYITSFSDGWYIICKVLRKEAERQTKTTSKNQKYKNQKYKNKIFMKKFTGSKKSKKEIKRIFNLIENTNIWEEE